MRVCADLKYQAIEDQRIGEQTVHRWQVRVPREAELLHVGVIDGAERTVVMLVRRTPQQAPFAGRRLSFNLGCAGRGAEQKTEPQECNRCGRSSAHRESLVGRHERHPAPLLARSSFAILLGCRDLAFFGAERKQQGCDKSGVNPQVSVDVCV
jgi:hypothetical protein